jgi:RNA polymerase sigma-70 factor (ECF subfamily)
MHENLPATSGVVHNTADGAMEMTVANTNEATYRIWVDLKSNLHKFIARRAGNEDDAEDILQDVFVKIHSNIGRLRDTTKLHPWVYQIARNAIIDHYRSRRPNLSLDSVPETLEIANEILPESDAEREEIAACLRPMVERLSNEYRDALVLADLRGNTQAQVASELNLSVSGAKSRVQRARGKMKEMLLDCCQFEFDQLGRAVAMNGRDCGSTCGPRKC